MNYKLKYNFETYELLGIIKDSNNEPMGYIENENAVYIPCNDKKDAIKTYRSVLREQINYLKSQKRKINTELIELKHKLQEVSHED